jgi:hypothetical protein
MSAERQPGWLRRVSLWHSSERPGPCGFDEVGERLGFPWFELVGDAGQTEEILAGLQSHCPGLTAKMLADLLTPDDSPKGETYGDGSIRLASTFGVKARQDEKSVERGTPRDTGVLVFQPVELIAGDGWLITCWHPTRVFEGPDRIAPDPPPESADEVFSGVVDRWYHGRRGGAGDLGIAIMHELALSYERAQLALMNWLEDWELRLYKKVENESKSEIDASDQLPELWGLMGVLRNWLTPVNRPGLRRDISKAWLPVTDKSAVVEVDELVKETLVDLAKLSETLRQAFGLLHVEQVEERRQREEKSARRLEILAAVFLVPTLVVGFYGANTWVPGQNKHWGFWVMVGALILLSCFTMAALRSQHRLGVAARRVSAEAARVRRFRIRNRDAPGENNDSAVV